MTRCVEGCGRSITKKDRRRFPQSLSRPRPAAQQSVINIIERIYMRFRCSDCFSDKYEYTAISYRWEYEDRSNSGVKFLVVNEAIPGRPTAPPEYVPVPMSKLAQLVIVMQQPLFFLDIINAHRGSRQWNPTNMAQTFGSSKKMLCLLNTSDRRIIERNREYTTHQTAMPRDRGPYLDSEYGQQERFIAYSCLDPSNVSFIDTSGADLGNIEVTGQVKEQRNMYNQVAAYGDTLFGSGNTRSLGSAVARRVRVSKHNSKGEKRLRGDVPDSFFVLNSDRIPLSDGSFPMPTLAHPDLPVPSSDTGLEITKMMAETSLGSQPVMPIDDPIAASMTNIPTNMIPMTGTTATNLGAPLFGEQPMDCFGLDHLTSSSFTFPGPGSGSCTSTQFGATAAMPIDYDPDPFPFNHYGAYYFN